jgi:predicted glycogen debranching enzyme
MHMLDFGREVTGQPGLVHEREWLVTNGIGGYACGTLSGVLRRVYHGLLVAALNPPLDRTVLLSKFDEIVQYDSQTWELFSNQWGAENINPDGWHHLERFRLEGTTPVWTYAIADARLEKRVWMQYGSNTTYIQYHYQRGSDPLQLSLKAITGYRDSHHVMDTDDVPMTVEAVDNGLRIVPDIEGAQPFVIRTNRADDTQITAINQWYEGYYLAVEKRRGLPHETANLHAGTFDITLQPGEYITLIASTDDASELNGDHAYQQHRSREQRLIQQSRLDNAPDWIQHLVLAADQFIVQRATEATPDGRTIIAGYHWFTDWGRDTMIALPGLTLTTQRHDEAARILRTYADYVDRGMIPNRFPDVGDEPEYNTVDATLWYINAVQEYYNASGDTDLLRDLYPVLQEIIDWHKKGTRYQIHMDADDGLLYAGEAGVQLTWMDAKINEWVITPRTGKPVEINALWYNALRAMADFARLLGELDADEYDTLANRVEASFGRFWNDDAGYCYDVIDTPDGSPDTSLRPNQLFAMSLEYSPLSATWQKAILDICGRKLHTSIGLRSLSPEHPDYKGDYDGDPVARDSRYHQGTVWQWLIGPYLVAHLNVYGDAETVLAMLQPFRHHLADDCIGSVSEVAQGNPPFVPRAAVAQAWSVAEVLRVWHLAQDYR